MTSLIFGLLAPSYAADASPTQQLRGITSIIAAQNARVRVELSEDAALAFDPVQLVSDDVTIRAKGRVTALILHRVGIEAAAGDTLIAAQFRFCEQPGCEERGAVEMVSDFGRGARDLIEIEKGAYDAYILTDGAPAVFEFNLDGLDGMTSISATETIGNGSVYTLERESTVLDEILPPHLFYLAGQSGQIDAGGGYAFFAVRSPVNWSITNPYQVCMYDGDPPPVGAYVTPCPGAQTFEGGVIGPRLDSYENVGYGAFGWSERGLLQGADSSRRVGVGISHLLVGGGAPPTVNVAFLGTAAA